MIAQIPRLSAMGPVLENLHSKVMFCGWSLKGQTLYNVPPSVENLRIDVEKCVNEHSEQMLSLLALLQDNRRRRGSVTGEAKNGVQ